MSFAFVFYYTTNNLMLKCTNGQHLQPNSNVTNNKKLKLTVKT